MKVLVVSLFALVASSVAAPHGFVHSRQDTTGMPFTWLSVLRDAHARGSILAPVTVPRASVVVGPHRGFTFSSNKPLSQWLHGVVQSAVAGHNSLHKSLAIGPTVNRYHGSFVVPARGFPQIPVVPTTFTVTRTHSVPSKITTASEPKTTTTTSPSTTTTTTSVPSTTTTTTSVPSTTTTTTSVPSTTTTTTSVPSTTTLLPRSLEGDTDVNYVGPVPRDNPDAEVFDEELLREDARNHFAGVSEEFGEAQPGSSEVVRSQPGDSKPTDTPFL